MLDDVRVQYARAASFLQNRNIKQALECADAAELLGYNQDDCSALRWDCWMLLGQFENAWAESDRIAARGGHDPHRFWDGQPLVGQRVMLRCLHGLGDAIQFIRYAPFIREQASSLVVETHPALVRLLRDVKGIDRVVTWGSGAPAEAPQWDVQIEINELPRIFRCTIATIPAQIPYISVPPKLSKLNVGRKRIGLVWASSAWNPARSVPINLLLEALSGVDADLFSLQHGLDRTALTPARAEEGDVFETAEDMMTMDLIISADTMTAHLAGALGIPVWVLLPFQADWRWMLDRSDSPWYPTMRLFRQPSQGDWAGALQLLRAAVLQDDPKVVESLVRN